MIRHYIKFGTYQQQIEKSTLLESLKDMYRTLRADYAVAGNIKTSLYWDLVLTNKTRTSFRVFRGFKPKTGTLFLLPIT